MTMEEVDLDSGPLCVMEALEERSNRADERAKDAIVVLRRCGACLVRECKLASGKQKEEHPVSTTRDLFAVSRLSLSATDSGKGEAAETSGYASYRPERTGHADKQWKWI